jgi:hypothetical protein
MRLPLCLGAVLCRALVLSRRLVAVSVSLLGLGRVDGLALVPDVGHESTVLISVVRHGLDATVREVHAVGT